MKSTFDRARRAIVLFNQNTALTYGESEIFFAHAVEMICGEDGLRVSDVLTKQDHKLVVLELTDAKRKPHRLLALWSEGRGQILYADEVAPRFKGFLAHEPTQMSEFPAGIATFMPPQLEEAITGGPNVPAPALTVVEQDVPLQPFQQRMIPESDLPLPYRMAHVFRRLVPAKATAFNLLVNVEKMASAVNGREPAFISGDKGMDLLRGGDFPRDTLNILEHEVLDMLKHKGLEDLEMVLDNPKLIPLAA